MATRKKAVAKAAKTDIAPASMFDDYAAKSAENVSADDMMVPRLAILQSLSPQLIKSKAEYIEGARQGDIVDVGMNQTWSDDDQPVLFLPCYYRKDFIEWQPRKKGGGLVNVHTSDECLEACEKDDDGVWITDDGNEIHPTAQFFGLNLSDGNRPCFIPMARTQLKYSKRWVNKLQAERNPNTGGPVAYFFRVYELSTVEESNDQGTWHSWKITPGVRLDETEGWQETAHTAIAFLESLSAGTAGGRHDDVVPSDSADVEGEVM